MRGIQTSEEVAIKLSPKGKEEIDQSQEKGVLGKVPARAQGGQGASSEDRRGAASKLSASGSNRGQRTCRCSVGQKQQLRMAFCTESQKIELNG